MNLKSYSQFGQDVHVVNNIYKNKRNGYFIEVGAYDGVTDSNTFLMESDYGWKGIVVECNPTWFENIIKHRNCIFFPYAVYNKDNNVLPFYNTGHGLSGLVETNHHKDIQTYAKVINVYTKTLTSILSNANAPRFIDFLSLDTEGSEYEILKTHDFEKYLFGYICVEHNNIEENRKKIRELLESKGYVFYRSNHVDDDYIHNSIVEHN
jgi:FkbM family methyltransferase